jgi:hypothetical protein
MAANEYGDDKIKDSLIALVELSAGAGKKFKSSNAEAKRRLAGFVFANLRLKWPSLCYELKKPFCWFPQCDDLVKWSALVDTLRTNSDMRLLIINRLPDQTAALVA